MKSYGQFCGVARALEIVGERWALLIVRDLLVGPRRYTDLRKGLPRIPTNVLATRLKELEQAGVVVRRVQPRPSGAVVYELTEYGAELDGIVLALGRWGAQRLGERGDDEIATADSMIMALRSTFRGGGLRAAYELRFGPIVIHAVVDGDSLVVGEGPLPASDLVIETTEPLRPLLAGEVTAVEMVAKGTIRLEGRAELLDRFAEAFRIGPSVR
jgi:DNA-binding HxlR family transcriptional regulator